MDTVPQQKIIFQRTNRPRRLSCLLGSFYWPPSFVINNKSYSPVLFAKSLTEEAKKRLMEWHHPLESRAFQLSWERRKMLTCLSRGFFRPDHQAFPGERRSALYGDNFGYFREFCGTFIW